MTALVERRDDATFAELVRLCTSDVDGAELAPLLDDPDPVQVDGRRRMSPWLLRRDAYALLSWIGRMDRRPVLWASAVPGGTQVSVLGVLAGEPVELVAVTHRPVRQGPLELDALMELARRELEELGAAAEVVGEGRLC